MAVASRTSTTVRCANCGNLGTHLNGAYCLHCRALLPPPGTPTRPLASARAATKPIAQAAAAVLVDARPVSPPAAPQPAIQTAPISAPVSVPAPATPLARPAIEQQLPRYGPAAPRPYALPYAPPYAPQPHAPRLAAPEEAPTIPSWLLPVRLVVFATAILCYVAALRLASSDTNTTQVPVLALFFLVIATAALIGSLGLRVYAGVLRRRILQWRPAPAAHTRAAVAQTPAAPQRRSIVGPAPAAPRNPYASAALLYGVISTIITIGAGLLGDYAFGLLSLYALYFGVRGVATGILSRTHAGLLPSLLGLLLSGFALVLTVLIATGIVPVMVSL